MEHKVLAEFRKTAKITQERAAEALGCSRDRIRRWENGKVDLPTSAIPKLATLYNRKPEELFAALLNPTSASESRPVA